MKNLLIIGAGGHGKVVADAAKCQGRWNTIAFLDDAKHVGEQIEAIDVVGRVADAPTFLQQYSDCVVAVGHNVQRLTLLRALSKMGFSLANVIHPSAVVASSVRMDAGIVVFANAVVNASATLGMGVIVNSGSIVEHDCVLEAGVHISPHASLAGGVCVGEYAWIGLGAAVIETIQIGAHVKVGAGAVVISDVLPHQTVVGVPALPLSSRVNLNGE